MRIAAALPLVLSVSVAVLGCGDDSSQSTPCSADQRVVSGACVACAPGSTNAAGDDPDGADTTCDAIACPLDQHVVAHACTACPPGSTNAAGDQASGGDTSCDGTTCVADQRVSAHACVACPAGSTNAAGDDAAGADTTCDATLCPADQHVTGHACVACGAGSTNAAGDDATGADTACDPTLCPVDQRVVAHACVACAPGSTNAAGDSAAGADTTCDPTLCPIDQRVSAHACVACAPGTTNAAGDNASGADTTCDPRLCAIDQRVSAHACVACAPGTTNAAGDDASGSDTSCEPRLCAADQRVLANACVACPPGTTNAAGDDASGANTTCDVTLCAADQHVVSNACVACPAGSTNAAGDDASGANTTCDATLCGADQRVAAHVCVACPAGSTNAAGDDASGANTTCDATLCPANQHVVANACTACPPGSTNAAGDNATGADTTCDATLCAVDQHVASNSCVACAPGTTNAAGDNATGADTTCDVVLCGVNERVQGNACVACPAGESNASGDDASGSDTSCDRMAVLRLSEVAPNQSSGRDLVELLVMSAGTIRDLALEQDGVVLTTFPEVDVRVGDLVIVHFNAAPGLTNELASPVSCNDPTCYTFAWDLNGGTAGITFSRRTLAVVDPYGDTQDAAAFSNLGTTPTGYPAELQALQAAGDWLPATCSGAPCTDTSFPSANGVSVDWTGVGTLPTSASVQRQSTVDTNSDLDWAVAPSTFGTSNPAACRANEHVMGHTCVPCSAGQSNLAGDLPTGIDTVCDLSAVLMLTEVAPNQGGSLDLVELLVVAGGTMRDLTLRQDGTVLATLPDVTVTSGQLVVVHLGASGLSNELATQTDCTSASCYPGAWDVVGTGTISFTRHVLAVVDALGDPQDVAAFTNLGTSPAGFPTDLQAVQNSGDWQPARCGGAPCTDATAPSANDVSADWNGVGTSPSSASVQRRSLIDTDSKADWGVVPGTIGVFNPGPCLANEHVVSSGCVACPAGTSNLAGDSPAGPDTACDPLAVLRITEVAPNQTSSRDLVELVVVTGGTVRGLTFQDNGTPLATLPDLVVTAGQLVVIHLNPSGPTTETSTQADCTSALCYAGAWDVNGGTAGIAFPSRRVLSIVDPSGDVQDGVAFTNNTTTLAGYPGFLQGLQGAGQWLPADCAGGPCTDSSVPSANDVSAVWTTASGSTPTSNTVQRSGDTNTAADWAVAAQTLGQ